jgi:hypothetical protein
MHTDRRSVLLSATALGLSALTTARAADRPSDKVRVAILGLASGKVLWAFSLNCPTLKSLQSVIPI